MTTSSATPAPAVPMRLSPAQHVIRHLRLAVPVMLARAGLIIMITVDTIMTGRSGAQELAHYAISLAPHMTLLVIGIGLMIGTVVLTAQADGAGRHGELGPIWFTSLGISGSLGLVTALVLLSGESLLRLLGQSAEMAAGGGQALVMFAAGMPAILMYIATSFFLEGISRPGPGMVIALSANVLNAALNWLLIGGEFGLPAMGAAGAALATTVTRWIMFLALFGYVLRLGDGARLGLRAHRRGRVAEARKLLRIGAPLAVATGLETACFATATTIAGWLGPVALAGYQVAFNVITFVFMFAIGLSTATSVRVANAVGRRDPDGVAAAGWTGVGLVIGLMAAVGAALLVFNERIAGLYSTDPAVLALAVPALAIAGILVVADGAQAVVMGALRGAGDVWLPTAACALAYWIVGVPSAYLLGYVGDGGIFGLIWGLFAGLCCAAVLLVWRFMVVARGAMRPL